MSDAPAGRAANPFPGLRPFREDEEYLFFGRESQVDAMVDRLAATHFLAVVGTSGSGKSSLVNCGLRPALRRGLMAKAGTAWRMAQFRPGNDPIGAMARALAKDGVLFHDHKPSGMTLPEIIETNLRMSKLGLIDIFEQAAPGEGVNLLVVVDQFEELFRYLLSESTGQVSDHDVNQETVAFVNLLLEIKERAAERIFVVLTMRSDFLGDCTKFPGLAEAINAGQYLVPRMTRDERRAAIERPVEVGGAKISPVLLTRLVNDVGDNPDQLSILQHALNRTWARWQSEGGKGLLELAHYEAIGTMAHALDQHAERALGELGSARQQQICEKLFKALTDKAMDPRGVRRPTRLAMLCALTDATAEEVTQVIAVFRRPSRSFLMPPDGEALTPATMIDISHESLMRVWERLTRWTGEEQRSAQTYRRLAEAAELHASGNASLWRDPELQLALDWRDKDQPNETWGARYHAGFATAMAFLDESRAAREAERAERQQQRQRELDAAREKAETQAKYARVMRWGFVSCGVLAVLATIAAVIASVSFVKAQRAAQEAERSKAEIQATQSRARLNAAEQVGDDHATKILLALEGLSDEKDGGKRLISSDGRRILSTGINDLRELAVLGHAGAVRAVAAMPDGRRIVTGSDDGTARLWDPRTGAVLELKGNDKGVRAVAVTSDGGRIIVGSGDGITRVWDIATGTVKVQLKRHEGTVRSVAVTPDQTRIITGSEDGTARVWNADTGEQLCQLKGYKSPVVSVAITPDGSHIITGSDDGIARVWSVESGEELRQLTGHAGAITGVAVTPDGTRIITGSVDGTVRIWDADTGETRLQFSSGPVRSLAVTPDGARIVTSLEGDIPMGVWDAATGAKLLDLKGNTNQVWAVAVTPDGTRIVTGSDDKTARLWDVTVDAALFQLRGHAGPVRATAITPDGTRIVTGSADSTARVWNVRTGAELLQLKGHSLGVLAVAVTPDGERIVTGSADATARVWDAKSGTELLQLKGHSGPVLGVAVAPDGGRIVTGSADATARVWDANTGTELLQLKGHTGAVLGVAIMPDAKRIVTASADTTARIWDAGTGAELLQLTGHGRAVQAIGVTRDGARIVTGSADGTARVWDAETGKGLFRMKGFMRPILSVAVTPDQAHFITGSDDGVARIWDSDTGVEQHRMKGHNRPILALAASPDGSRIVTASADSAASVWVLALLHAPPQQYQFSTKEDRLAVIEHAKAIVPRCLTIEQRKDLLLDPPPPRWCIGRFPYDTKAWKAWQARHDKVALDTVPAEKDKDALDTEIAEKYGDFADKVLKKGADFASALQAAEIGLEFDPDKTWILINKAEAHMFLGQTDLARKEYLAHRGEKLDLGEWDKLVLEDFQALREEGLEDDLMTEIERELAPSSAKTAKRR